LLIFSTMRTTTALVLLALALALAAAGEPIRRFQGAEAAAPTDVTPLVGAWNGQWTAPAGVHTKGAVELVLARVPGRDTVLGHFTFMAGGPPRTFRYEGRLDNGVLQFPLVGEGRILLAPRAAARPATADVLQGEWVDAAGVLPAPSGTLQLSRVPLH
jgi:hypothetical protein